MAGSRNVSPEEMWLPTKIAGPETGMFSSPSILVPNSNRTPQTKNVHLNIQYSNEPPVRPHR